MLFYSLGKYLLVSQEGHEIVDLVNPNTKYEFHFFIELWENVPRVDYATGGILQNSPIVCGGLKDDVYDELGKTFQDCVVIGQPEMEMKMTQGRYNAASVALDQSTLWIAGGEDEYLNDLSSTEVMKLGQPSVKG